MIKEIKSKKLLFFLILVVSLISFSVSHEVYATTLTTKVPADMNLTVNISGNGSIQINDKRLKNLPLSQLKD